MLHPTLLRLQRVSQTLEIMSSYANSTSMRALNVGNQPKCYGHRERQDQKYTRVPAPRAVPNQQVAAESDCYHQPHAGVGMRFHHAACVYPCEFNTSFMPEIASATSGVGCAVRDRTADHNSF